MDGPRSYLEVRPTGVVGLDDSERQRRTARSVARLDCVTNNTETQMASNYSFMLRVHSSSAGRDFVPHCPHSMTQSDGDSPLETWQVAELGSKERNRTLAYKRFHAGVMPNTSAHSSLARTSQLVRGMEK